MHMEARFWNKVDYRIFEIVEICGPCHNAILSVFCMPSISPPRSPVWKPIILNKYGMVGRSGSNPKLPNDTELLLVRTVIIDKSYQKTRNRKKSKVVANDFWQDKRWPNNRQRSMMSAVITKRIKGRTGSLISLFTENHLSRHTSCACRILLPLSISKSSFYSLCRDTPEVETRWPRVKWSSPASDWVDHRGSSRFRLSTVVVFRWM